MRSSVVAKSRPAREGSGVSTAPPFAELMACKEATRHRLPSYPGIMRAHLHHFADAPRIAGVYP
jgi:hypothetical protein